jgi:hypothetical protein
MFQLDSLQRAMQAHSSTGAGQQGGGLVPRHGWGDAGSGPPIPPDSPPDHVRARQLLLEAEDECKALRGQLQVLVRRRCWGNSTPTGAGLPGHPAPRLPHATCPHRSNAAPQASQQQLQRAHREIDQLEEANRSSDKQAAHLQQQASRLHLAAAPHPSTSSTPGRSHAPTTPARPPPLRPHPACGHALYPRWHRHSR